MLEQFFSFNSLKDLDTNLDVFKCLIFNFTNYKVTFSDENNDVILLNSLFEIYKDIKNAIKYGRTYIIVDVVVNSLRNLMDNFL